jgi:DNA polymerase elongation subunit (family B)
LQVVYGDTDSVFINSNATNLADALQVAEQFKKSVNGRYRLLEIDLDGIFQRLLLLQKKKYAALKVEDGQRTSIEIKGLDMKRREYCALSKNASKFVYAVLLSVPPLTADCSALCWDAFSPENPRKLSWIRSRNTYPLWAPKFERDKFL